MERIEYSHEVRSAWQSYPVRILGPKLSRCHQTNTILVRSTPGGFVTANCSKCGKRDTLDEAGFRGLDLWVSCPTCGKRMTADLLPNLPKIPEKERNYGFACASCSRYLWLADLLPDWNLVFNSSGGQEQA